MNRHRRGAFACVVLLFTAAVGRVHGQQRGVFLPPTLLDVLPSSLAPHAEALGDRVLKPGKEKTTIISEIVTDRGERRQLRVILQLPALVRIDELKGNRASAFDGTASAGVTSRTEEQLLEIFSSDTAEALMASSRDGGAFQLLGRFVKSVPEGKSPLYDIYEWSGPIRSLPLAPDRLKRYAFDSETGLLAYTEYSDDSFSPPLGVRIQFSDWKKFDGSSYPGRIDRFENGLLTFSWTALETASSRRQDTKLFSELNGMGKEQGK